MICSKYDKDSVLLCTNLLRENKVLVLPTDTVYGFSGIAGVTDEQIRNIKGREENKPFIQLISFPSDIKNFTEENIPKNLISLWPGPITIIVPKKENPLQTVALRCPGDKWLREVIEKTGKPLNSTSVNRSGKPILKSVLEIEKEFGNEVSLIVDAGITENAVPSTIVKVLNGKIEVIRQGALKI